MEKENGVIKLQAINQTEDKLINDRHSLEQVAIVFKGFIVNKR